MNLETALTRHQIFQHLELRLSSFQNSEKETCVVKATQAIYIL